MKDKRPPLIARKLLKWMIAEAIYDEVIGDLNELFELRSKEKGLWIARLYFLKDTFLSVRNLRLRRKHQTQNPTTMYRNYLKVAWRNVRKHKFYAAANTISLALGLASAMLILLFVNSELSFDKFHENGDRLYRLNKVVNRESGSLKNPESSGSFGPQMVEDFPEVEAVTRYELSGNVVYSYGDKNLRVGPTVFVDANFFQVFDFELIRGNAEDALTRPSTMVLTESAATSIFGEEDPMNKLVKGRNGIDFIVTGIVKDPPANSHLQFKVLISWATTVPGTGPLNVNWMNNWLAQGIATYVLLSSSESAGVVNEKLPAFEEQHMPTRADRYDFYLQPFQSIYLGSEDVQFNAEMTGTRFLYVLSSIALAILLIAIFNYINISTAKATMRAKEVGVRKVIGAKKAQLIIQHLVESFLMVLLASILGLLLLNLAIPSFNQFTGRSLSMDTFGVELGLIMMVLIVFVSLVSGIYPALMVAGFKTVSILKSGSGRVRGNMARQLLITFQFVITIIMIAGTVMISRQTHYMQEADLGYDNENVLMAEMSDALYEDHQPFEDALAANRFTSNYSLSQQTPKMSNIGYSVFPEGISENEVDVRLFRVDERFIDLYDMEMTAGRNFDKNIRTDNRSVIINETMQQLVGWDDPIGQTLTIGTGSDIFTVTGVVKDFNFYSLHREVAPIVMLTTQTPYNISIKVTEATRPQAIAALEDIWVQFEKREPLKYSFLRDDLANFYDGERNILKAIIIFALISIVISCFGLYGLTAFTVERKFKEIGIRKTLGAGESAILMLINKRFLIIAMIAFVIAMPVAYYLIDQWLQSFAYRVSLGAGVFLMALFMTLMITMATISFQTLKAARANPVKALRVE